MFRQRVSQSPEKVIAVLPFENLSRRSRERLFCRWHSGGNPHATGEDRGFESDFAHVHAAFQKRAG